MRKNRLIALIGTLTMAAAGLAAVSVGSKNAKEAKAESDWSVNILLTGQLPSWADSNSAKVYFGGDWTDNQGSAWGWNSGWDNNSITAGGAKITCNIGAYERIRTGVIHFTEGGQNKQTKDISIDKTLDYTWDGAYIVFNLPADLQWDGDKISNGSMSVKSSSVTLNVNGGSCSSLTSYYDGIKTSLPTASKSGYTFDGWSKNQDLSGTLYREIPKGTTGNQTYYAKYTELASTYTINFAAGEGEGSMSPVTPTASQAYTLPSRSGQIYKSKAHFDHWDDGLGHTYEDGATVPANRYSVGQNVTLTAIYREYDISDGWYIEFDGTHSPQRIKLTYNGKTGDDSEQYSTDISMAAGDSFKVVHYEDENIDITYGTDQTYAGGASDAGQIYSDNGSFKIRVAGTYDLYLHDQWSSYKIWIPANTYTVTYHSNNDNEETSDPQTANCYITTDQYSVEKAADVYGKSTFSSADSTLIFDGWSTNPNAKTGDLKPGDMVSTASKVPASAEGTNVDLYAIWRDKNPQDGYYVKVFNGDHAGNYAMTLKEGSETEYVTSISLAANDEFKVVKYKDEVIRDSDYHGYSEFKYGAGSARSAGQIIESTSEHNLKAKTAGTYKVYYDETGSQIGGSGDYHIWIANSVDVSFNMNGFDGEAPASISVGNGDKISAPVAPEISGYTFDAWYEDSDCENEWDFSNDSLTWSSVEPNVANYDIDAENGSCTKTLYANYTEDVTYVNVTIASNNTSFGTVDESSLSVASGIGYSVDENTLTIGDTIITATPADSTGAQYSYAFDKWTVNSSEVTSGTISADTNFVANFTQTTKTYTITWKNYNGTTLETDENVAYGATPSYDGATPVKPSSAEHTYTFSGWSPAVSLVTGSAEYTAQFSESTRKYTVTFENDGNGKVYCEDLETEASSITVPYGTTISTNGAELTVGTNEYLAIENDIQGSTVTFKDWTISPAGSTVAGNVTITANFTVVANEYMLAYEFNGGTPTSEDYSHEGFDYHYGDEIELPTLTKDGYSFVGFCEDEELEGDCYVDTYTLTDDVELYAKFTLDSYNITFSNNGGQGGSIDKTSYSISELDQVVNITAPTKEGNGPSYTITKGDDYVGDDPVVQNSSVIIPHGAYGSFSINTVWTPDTYTVTYAPGAYGQEAQSTATKIYNVDLTLAGAIFTRTGYTQVGWAKSDGGAKVYDLSTIYSANAGVTLYPVWEVDTYTVSYNKGQYGAGEIASQTKTYDEALTLSSSTFTREGYRQDGWSISDSGAKVYELGASYTNNEAVTLYPHWVKQCVVTFASSNSEYGSVSSSGPITVDEGTSVTVSGNSITIGTTTVTATPTTSTDDVEYSFTGWSVSTGSTISSNTEIFANFESELTALGEAKQYAQGFIDKMNDTCDLEEDADGNIIVKTEIAKLQAAWKDEFGAFNELSPEAQNYLTGATPVYDEGSTDVLGKFAASYDYIYGKYHGSLDEIDGDKVGDFAKREPNQFANSRLFSVSEVSTSTWIIAAVAVVGIAAVGVFFIYRKRKEI